MENLCILEKELTPELQVVLEERRMRVDNVPLSSLLSTKRCANSCSAATSPTAVRRSAAMWKKAKKLTPDDLDGLLQGALRTQ